MKIAIIGAGGLGAYFGGLLSRSGHDVTFVARGDHLRAIQSNGLYVKSVNGDFHLPTVQAAKDLDGQRDSIDVALITCKAKDLESSAKMLGPALQPHSAVIHVQNGVDIFERLSQHLPADQIYPGVAYIVSLVEKPGHIWQKSAHKKISFGSPHNDNQPAILKQFINACEASQFEAEWSENIHHLMWDKFIFISAFSGLTALTQKTIGQVLGDNETTDLFRNCLLETIRVANATGLNFPEDETLQKKLDFTKSLEPTLTSSLQADIAKGKESELEILTGAVVKLGEKYNIPTPVNVEIYSELKRTDEARKIA